MDYVHRGSVPSSSLKQKLRSSNCFSCCFRANGGGGTGGALESPDDGPPASLIRSSSTWLLSKAQELPELKDKCRGLISRIRKPRRHSGDFRYDPLSYALNFDEGPEFDEDGEISPAEFRYRNFSSRLPASPPQPPHKIAAAVKEIACN